MSAWFPVCQLIGCMPKRIKSFNIKSCFIPDVSSLVFQDLNHQMSVTKKYVLLPDLVSTLQSHIRIHCIIYKCAYINWLIAEKHPLATMKCWRMFMFGCIFLFTYQMSLYNYIGIILKMNSTNHNSVFFNSIKSGNSQLVHVYNMSEFSIFNS